MILSVCHKHGLHPQGKCPTCVTADNRRRNNKPKRRQWKTEPFQEARAYVLRRDGNRCTQCGNSDQLTVHHGEHGTTELHLWKTLCLHCHGAIDGAGVS